MTGRWQIGCKDVLGWCAEYDGPKFHAMLCDPPYHLTSITKRFGGKDAAPAQYGRDGAFQRLSKGFMNTTWDGEIDGVGIAFRPETWAALKEHLLPGAFIFVFGSSRGWHRLAVAIEDAGFVFHPSLMVWGALQGQGFPKSTRIERTSSNGNLPFCQCADSPPLSPEHDSQYNARDEMNKAADSQLSCPQDCRQDDEQPHLALASVRDGEPLQDDAQEHNHSDEPSVENQEDSEPLHSPCQAQCSVPQRIDNAQDRQGLSDGASQLQQDHVSETYHVEHSRCANKDDNVVPVPHVVYEGDDIEACHNLHTDSSDSVLSSGSLDTPFAERCVHYTTEGPYCQVCGKIKRDIWEGHRYGRQALKPAVEMIICAQKPYEDRPVDCIVETGAGALFIDGGRVGTGNTREKGITLGAGKQTVNTYGNGINSRPIDWQETTQGRWPPNFCLLHSPDCQQMETKRVRSPKAGEPFQATNQVYGKWHQFHNTARYADADGTEEIAAWDCCESCAARKIGEQSGERHSSCGGGTSRNVRADGIQFTQTGNEYQSQQYFDKGNCTRFFPQFGWAAEIAERLAAADQVRYCAKASRNERDAGLDQVEVQTPQAAYGNFKGTPGHATNMNGKQRCIHPCVKPVSLCHWLATLLLPPPEYAPRRILIPFAGVMSEAIAATLAGWEEIVAIEMSEEYCAIGEARLQFWSQFNSYEEAMETARNARRGQRRREAEIEKGQLGLWREEAS